MVFQDEEGLLDLPRPRLSGAHQIVNAAMAVATLRAAGLPVSVEAVESGLQRVDWPGRMQPLGEGPLLDLCPPGTELWLDGGHNPGAGAVVAAAMADREERAPRPLHLVAGMLKTKDPVGFFAPFAGLAAHVDCVALHTTTNGRDPADLVEAARAAGLVAEVAPSVEAALRRLPRDGDVPPRVLVCGSLYLAGEVLAANGMSPE